MKSLVMVGGLFGALASLGLLGSTAFAAAPQPNSLVPHAGQTINITLNPFCDGLAITVGSAGAPGVQATPTGCGTGEFGLYGASGSGGIGLGDAPYGEYYVINANHTWANYDTDCGNGIECLLNSGTWTLGAPPDAPAQAALRPSHAGSPSAGELATGPLPLFTINVNFSDSCAGMQLNLPGAAGWPGMDGTETGCDSNPVIGSMLGRDGSAGMWDIFNTFFAYIGTDHNVIEYGQNQDGTEYILYSGSWAYGAPPPAAPQTKRLPSTSGVH
ncbi:MAG: hypothetical protein ACRESR_03470 [Gammaproteobacteria bacterium]